MGSRYSFLGWSRPAAPVLRSAQEPYTPADAHQDRQTIDDENLASHNDPLGSWTGVPDQADEMPTQDQDDL